MYYLIFWGTELIFSFSSRFFLYIIENFDFVRVISYLFEWTLRPNPSCVYLEVNGESWILVIMTNYSNKNVYSCKETRHGWKKFTFYSHNFGACFYNYEVLILFLVMFFHPLQLWGGCFLLCLFSKKKKNVTVRLQIKRERSLTLTLCLFWAIKWAHEMIQKEDDKLFY